MPQSESSTARRSSHPGLALLEVLIAMSMLAISGLTSVALIEQTSSTLRDLRARETRMHAAVATLEHISLWHPSDFVARQGTSHLRGFLLKVEQTAPALWSVTLADAATGNRVLSTAFYASDTTDAGLVH